MAHELVLRGGLQITSTPESGTGDPQLTLDTTTKKVGEIPAVDTTTFIPKSLLPGYILVGNGSGIATGVLPSGALTLSTGGVTTLNTGVVFNANVNASAAIAYSKLNLSNSIVNADINTSAAITRTKLASGTAYRILANNATGVLSENAALTASKVIVSDINGQLTTANPTTTEINYVAGVTSALQTQLSTKLTFSGSPTNGDILYYNGGSWLNLAVGSAGQVLLVSGGLPSWGAATANGLPVGGTAGQYLNKIDGTNYNAQWSTLTLSKVTDVTATPTEVNKLSGVTTSTAQFNYLNTATGPLQAQIDSKLGSTLSTGSIWVGLGGTASPLAIGSSGQVLTVSGGTATWQTISGTGTVTSVDVSGGSTGLTTSGGPISTNGTITLSGTLVAANGGTGLASYTTGDLLYASGATTLSKRAAVATGAVLGAAGVATAPVYLTVDGGLTASGTNLRFGGTLVNGLTTVSVGSPNSQLVFGAQLAGTPYFNFNNVSATRSVISLSTYGTATTTNAGLTFDSNGTSPSITIGASSAGTSTTTLSIGGNLFNISGPASFAGAVYNADYTANFGTRSLIDQGYLLTGTVTLQNKTLGTGTKVALGSDATGDIYYNGGSGTFTRLPVSTNGFVLTLAGGVPTWAVASGGFTNPMTTKGDIIVGDTGGAPIRLALGTNTQVLTSNGTTAVWSTPVTGVNPFTLNPQSGNYTFVLADGSATSPVLVQATTATTQTLTIPLNASVPFPLGTQLNAIWDGTGTPVFAITGGGTLTPTAGAGIYTFPGVRSIVTAIKYATDSWYLLNAVPFATQTANTVLAGPTSGGAATPTFRGLVLTDLPFTGTPTNLLFARGDGTWASPKISDLAGAGVANTIDNANFKQEWQWATLAGGTGLKLSSTSTSAASNTQKLLEIDLSGANSSSTQTTYGGSIRNAHTGTTSTNIGLYLEASGGTTNISLMAALGSSVFGNSVITAGSVLAEFYSSTQGVLFPRITNQSAVATPVGGMQAYDSSLNRMAFYQNGAWSLLNSQVIGKVDDIASASSYGLSEILSGVTNTKSSTYFSNNVNGSWNGANTTTNVLNTVPNNTMLLITGTFVGVQTSGTAGSTGFHYVIQRAFRRTGTTTTAIAAAVVLSSSNDTGLTFSTVPNFTTSGSNIDFVRQLSATSTTFNVSLKIQVDIVG